MMDDPSKKDWFLPFDAHNTTPYHVPQCDNNYSPPRCTALYHDQERASFRCPPRAPCITANTQSAVSPSTETPGFPHGDGVCPGPCDCGVHPCGEYLFDYTNATTNGLADFIVNDFVLGPTGLGNTNISGFYLDDEWYNFSRFPAGCSGSPVGGPTEEDPHCLADMGHTGDLAWTTAVTDAWCAVRHRAFAAAIAAGGWFWQLFSTFATPTQPTCATTLRALCAAGASSTYFNSTTMHALSGDHATLPNLAQDLATFLLLRGDYAFLGFGWSGCGYEVHFPSELGLDYGVPTGLCAETSPDVFTREWSKATVEMDCARYVGTVTMK